MPVRVVPVVISRVVDALDEGADVILEGEAGQGLQRRQLVDETGQLGIAPDVLLAIGVQPAVAGVMDDGAGQPQHLIFRAVARRVGGHITHLECLGEHIHPRAGAHRLDGVDVGEHGFVDVGNPVSRSASASPAWEMNSSSPMMARSIVGTTVVVATGSATVVVVVVVGAIVVDVVVGTAAEVTVVSDVAPHPARSNAARALLAAIDLNTVTSTCWHGSADPPERRRRRHGFATIGAMDISEAAAIIADAVDANGLLLVHDQRLPSATALIAGEPVMGSWWSHPEANTIYNALGALQDRYATVKLVAGKQTLLAPRLWPDLIAIGSARQRWQLDSLSEDDLALLDQIASATHPVLLHRPDLRAAGKRLEQRLLVVGDEVHTEAGRHLRALASWPAWAREHGVAEPMPAPRAAMARFESIVEQWGPGSISLLPWT